jgi:hypothetical protein
MIGKNIQFASCSITSMSPSVPSIPSTALCSPLKASVSYPSIPLTLPVKSQIQSPEESNIWVEVAARSQWGSSYFFQLSPLLLMFFPFSRQFFSACLMLPQEPLRRFQRRWKGFAITGTLSATAGHVDSSELLQSQPCSSMEHSVWLSAPRWMGAPHCR